jgi:hypothetical protein
MFIENKFVNRKLEKRGVVRATSVCGHDNMINVHFGYLYECYSKECAIVHYADTIIHYVDKIIHC